MAARDVVVVGASAGGVEALRAFIGTLPDDLPAAVLVVLHLPAGGSSALARILTRAGPLLAVTAEDRQPLRPGCIHVARPDRHLLVVDDHVRLSRGPTENGHRPAVDALFRSAARALGPRVIGVVLSGALDDGAAGMVSIASQGGVTMVQDPEEALYRGMPQGVLRRLRPEYVLPASQLGKVVAERLGERIDPEHVPPLSALELLEADLAERGDSGVEHEVIQMGELSGLTCPDCQGALVELAEGERYRCRVGHAWTARALVDAQSSNLERALWTALRMLEERASLTGRLRNNADADGRDQTEAVYSAAQQEMSDAIAVLRRFLLSGLPTGARAPATTGLS